MPFFHINFDELEKGMIVVSLSDPISQLSESLTIWRLVIVLNLKFWVSFVCSYGCALIVIQRVLESFFIESLQLRLIDGLQQAFESIQFDLIPCNQLSAGYDLQTT